MFEEYCCCRIWHLLKGPPVGLAVTHQLSTEYQFLIRILFMNEGWRSERWSFWFWFNFVQFAIKSYIRNPWPWVAYSQVNVGRWVPLRLSSLKVAPSSKKFEFEFVCCMFCPRSIGNICLSWSWGQMGGWVHLWSKPDIHMLPCRAQCLVNTLCPTL